MEAEVLFACTTKVKGYGGTACIMLHARAAKLLSITRDTRLYAYRDGNAIVYSPEPPSDRTCVELKPRLVARHGSKEYYLLTIPAKLARALRIQPGEEVVLAVRGGKIVLEKLAQKHVKQGESQQCVGAEAASTH